MRTVLIRLFGVWTWNSSSSSLSPAPKAEPSGTESTKPSGSAPVVLLPYRDVGFNHATRAGRGV